MNQDSSRAPPLPHLYFPEFMPQLNRSMIRRGTFSRFIGLVAILSCTIISRADAPADLPDFKEVYDLIREHVAGLNQAQLDHAAVLALISGLAPKVSLVGKDNEANSAPSLPLLSKTSIFDGDVAYLRASRVGTGLPEAVHKACAGLVATNKLKGLVLDLRYTTGDDYAAAAGVADQFVSKDRPLLDWGKGMVRSKEKTDALTLPVAVLVNHQTAAAAEALAALFRETGTGLILGSQTAGQAMIAQEFPLKNGDRLRIATGPIQVGESAALTPEGVSPDVSVQVAPEEERSYYADAFRNLQNTNQLFANAGLSFTNQASSTNRARRTRFNEAELVRERREGPPFDNDSAPPRETEPEKPVVRDPALARALDVLKGLAVVRRTRS